MAKRNYPEDERFEERFLDLLTDELKDVKGQVRTGFEKTDRKINKLTKELEFNTDETKGIKTRLASVEAKVTRLSLWQKLSDNPRLLLVIAMIILATFVLILDIRGIDVTKWLTP